jgi:predicted amidohydrolase YtcJ
VLIVDGEVDGRPGLRVRVAGVVEAVAPNLTPQPGEDVLDARGGAILPGLHDHHLHLRSVLAARRSVQLDGRNVRTALRAAADQGSDQIWVRAVGYHEAAAGRLDRDVLDDIVPERPVRVLHRTGEMWVLNSAALTVVGAETAIVNGIERDPGGRPTGRLMRLDRWLDGRVPRSPPTHDEWRAVAAAALACGVTGWTDATPGRDQGDVSALSDICTRGIVRQRLTLMVPPDVRAESGVSLGPTKIVLDDTSLPSGAELVDLIGAAHVVGRAAAIHCVTIDQLSVALHAFERTGASDWDRIEHASVVAPSQFAAIAALGVTVVTQPGLVYERGDDYLREVAEPERDWLYPAASLLRAGIPLAGSTDAPHTHFDVWRGIAAAMDRKTRSGALVGAEERLTARAALGLFLGRPEQPGTQRRVAPGEPGDLCVLTAPLEAALSAPNRSAVAYVVLNGEIVHAA